MTTPRGPHAAACTLVLALACVTAAAACGSERTVTAPDTPASSPAMTATGTSPTMSSGTTSSTGSSGSSNPSNPGRSSSPGPEQTPPLGGGPETGDTAAPTGPTLAACTATDTVVATNVEPGSAGAGHYSLRLTARHIGTRSCTLRGYPGVSIVDAAGRQLGRAASRKTADTPTIILPPGASASTLVRVTQAANYPTCTTAPGAGLRVYLPGERAALLADYNTIVACTDDTTPTLLEVAPFS